MKMSKLAARTGNEQFKTGPWALVIRRRTPRPSGRYPVEMDYKCKSVNPNSDVHQLYGQPVVSNALAAFYSDNI